MSKQTIKNKENKIFNKLKNYLKKEGFVWNSEDLVYDAPTTNWDNNNFSYLGIPLKINRYCYPDCINRPIVKVHVRICYGSGSFYLFPSQDVQLEILDKNYMISTDIPFDSIYMLNENPESSPFLNDFGITENELTKFKRSWEDYKKTFKDNLEKFKQQVHKVYDRLNSITDPIIEEAAGLEKLGYTYNKPASWIYDINWSKEISLNRNFILKGQVTLMGSTVISYEYIMDDSVTSNMLYQYIPYFTLIYVEDKKRQVIWTGGDKFLPQVVILDDFIKTEYTPPSWLTPKLLSSLLQYDHKMKVKLNSQNEYQLTLTEAINYLEKGFNNVNQCLINEDITFTESYMEAGEKEHA